MSALAEATESVALDGVDDSAVTLTRVSSIRFLTCKVRVASNCHVVHKALAALYPGGTTVCDHSSVRASADFSVDRCRGSGGRSFYRLSEVGANVHLLRSAEDAVACLEYFMTSAAIKGLSANLLVHAGAVSWEDRAILLPAPSGTGKSTLVAALCLSGFRYMSDELAVVDGKPPFLLPFLKAICLKEGGWQTLEASLGLPAAVLNGYRADGEAVRYIAPSNPASSQERLPVGYVVLPLRDGGARARLSRCSRAFALAELARNSLNLPRHAQSGLETLAELVEGAECYALYYGDLRSAIGILSRLVGRPSSAGTGEAIRAGSPSSRPR